MPKKRQTRPADSDPDSNVAIRSLALDLSGRHAVDSHHHDWHQLIYASRGVVSVHTASGAWVVPPERAVWVPAGVRHRVEMAGPVSLRTLYLRPGLARAMPSSCSVVYVSSLLRELIQHACSLGALSRSDRSHAPWIAVILDQLKSLGTLPLELPMPRDHRARRAAAILSKHPGRSSSGSFWHEVGASKRTLERVIRAETGLTFGRWRQQLRLLHALRQLAAGRAVSAVAREVGYYSTSAFIAMFRKALGATPSQWASCLSRPRL